MPVARSMFLAAAIGGRVYCVGGNDPRADPYAAIHAYDTAANRWSERARWPTPSPFPCGAAVGGKLYVVGGPREGARRACAVERYDPGADRWERLADLPVPRSHSAAAALGERLYVLGGFGVGDPGTGALGRDLDDVWVLDTRAGRWSRGPRLPAPRHGHSAAALGGAVHVVGGLNSQTEHYALVGAAWRRRADCPVGVVKMAAAAAGGKLVVAGAGGSMREVAVYDPATDSWAGVDGSADPQAMLEWYDPATGRWRE
jgi:N-acetylneuraminic acid mutarotase